MILSVVLFTIFNMTHILYKQNQQTYNITISKIDLETTRLFLQKQIIHDNNLIKLTLQNTNLLYDNNLLLQNISTYKQTFDNININITICIQTDIKLCQDMIIQKKITD